MEFIVLGGVLAIGAIYFLWRKGKGGGSARRFRCVDCRHRGRLLDDGVICEYQNASLYKNPIQIRTCMNHEKES